MITSNVLQPSPTSRQAPAFGERFLTRARDRLAMILRARGLRASHSLRLSPEMGVAGLTAGLASVGAKEPALDRASMRVRQAGGPLDLASYSCECGCIFPALVTTTVTCPHCSTPQPW